MKRCSDGMKDYGGYIELERFYGEEYHPEALALNSGRHCLEYLIRARKIRKLYIPYFLCDSVSELCRKLDIETAYYHIDSHFQPQMEFIPGDCEWLYVVNFYGQLTDERIAELKARFPRLIVDQAQAFFQKPLQGVDTLYTCRKFFGVSDGAYLYTDAKAIEIPEVDSSCERMHFLLGRFEHEASAYYGEYVENNRLFAREPMKRMSPLTHNLLRGIDYERAARTRTENYACLHRLLGEINRLELSIPQGAFMYPLHIEGGSELRQALQREKIYIPLLWPAVTEICGPEDMEYSFAQDILPLPVDQRYSTEDMRYIAERVLKLRGIKDES